MTTFFENTFKNIPTPVIVCLRDEPNELVFVNPSAKIMLNPFLSMEKPKSEKQIVPLDELMRFESGDAMRGIRGALSSFGSISHFPANVLTYEGETLSVSISANLVALDGADYYVLYLYELRQDEEQSILEQGSFVSLILHAAYDTVNVNAAIHKILEILGSYVHVSRVYIFEDLQNGFTRNTYEWCDVGVAPAIQDLQNLKKDDYNYDEIVSTGMFVTDDIRELPDTSRKILAAQGIKSLAILTLYHGDTPLGYVGLDDCVDYRKWSKNEIQLLKQITNILVSLIERRNAEKKEALTFEILKTISDNIDSVIYVSDIQTYEIIFANKALSESLGIESEKLIGGTCWKLLQKGKEAPCEFCPIPQMVDSDGNIILGNYSWEFQNTITGKWYLVRDAIIKWIDGRDVHIETATDITGQKKHEEQLRYYASTDTMTGAYNREWGYKMIRKLMDKSADPDASPEEISLCFLDLDGLKSTNDTYGHDAGDEMILAIVKTIHSCIRKSDILCRWGGDEFIVLLRCNTQMAEKLMKRTQEALEVINRTGERPYMLSFSFGVVSLRQDVSMDVDAIISMADAKMYEQKVRKRIDSGRPDL